jgi:hypothetical protein
MMRKMHPGLIKVAALLGLAGVVGAGVVAGCGSSTKFEVPGNGGPDATSPFIDGGLFLPDGFSPGDAGQTFDVQPSALQTVTVTMGQSSVPTVAYSATLNGKPVNAAWTLDRGEIGSIGAGPSAKATFQPTGTTGGLVTIRATAVGITAQRQVFVKIVGTQNGAGTSPAEAAQIPTSVSQLGSGGGVGGVGGEGLGGAVTNAPTLMALQNPAGSGRAQGLTLLYPYDQTVFPRSMLAPLLQWTFAAADAGVADADAVQIQLQTTSGSFSWTGTFGRPAILAQSGGTFIRHPIPQDVWATATNTAGGTTPGGTLDKLTVSLVIAKSGQGYGPITETWIIAPGRLEGTVYYNSYGTQLVKNSIETAYHSTEQFGAAVLGIAEGATSPVVVAGTPSAVGSGAGCRVCHVVAANGSRLIAQHGDNYSRTSSYDLKNGNAETSLNAYDGLFGWAGLSPDGTLALTSAAELAAGTPASQLYAFLPASSTPLPVTGIPANLQAGTPAFSPDGKHVTFEFIGGTIGSTTGNGTQLVAMDFAPGAGADGGAEGGTSATFSNLQVLATMNNGQHAGFPSFFPTNDAVAFHYQIARNGSDHRYATWQQAKAQIWWSDVKTGTATVLAALNGLSPGGTTSYLPKGPNNHADDTVINYEPTVSPVSSGGYIWVIFTSRRLYGNVATADPWQSDPRNYDATAVANATTKKLWVAAIDLNAKPGTDPSHPAFYLPAQELLAGNMRGFWVISPCKSDTMGCSSGDQCCNGYCRAAEGSDAGLVCTTIPPLTQCSQVGEKCVASSDCCDTGNVCVNGFCAIPTPQ